MSKPVARQSLGYVGVAAIAGLLFLPLAGWKFGRISYDNALAAVVLSVLPLLAIAAKLVESRGRAGFASAIVCCFVGYALTYQWAAHGGEHIMLWGGALLVYWICGIAALFSTNG